MDNGTLSYQQLNVRTFITIVPFFKQEHHLHNSFRSVGGVEVTKNYAGWTDVDD